MIDTGMKRKELAELKATRDDCAKVFRLVENGELEDSTGNVAGILGDHIVFLEQQIAECERELDVILGRGGPTTA